MKSKGREKKLFTAGVLIVLLLLFFYWQNNDIVLTKMVITSMEVPKEFNDFKILHVSDLHNKEFGKNQSGLMKYTKEIEPDIIVVTGDLIDSRRTDIDMAMEYIDQVVLVAPVYFVTGNHEKRCAKYPELEKRLLAAGVTILDEEAVVLEKGNTVIGLLGLGDPSGLSMEDGGEVIIDNTLDTIANKVLANYKILLSHRPELIDIYANHEINLVFSGHAHGGQFRIPGLGGLIAPNQGFFPKYTSGEIKKGNTSMFVSRGLGNSVIPVRIFNRPELIEVTLKHKED